MSHTVTHHALSPGRYAVLLCVMLTASIGDTLLSHGMRQVGPISLHHLGALLTAMQNPWVIAGILCLIGFFGSYLTALSWADLTFVLPATAFGYVVIALLSHFWLHEHISGYRWAGILLIVCGVGFVANGPARTEHAPIQPATAADPPADTLTNSITTQSARDPNTRSTSDPAFRSARDPDTRSASDPAFQPARDANPQLEAQRGTRS